MVDLVNLSVGPEIFAKTKITAPDKKPYPGHSAHKITLLTELSR
jgi:hypothetical protein